MIGQLLKKNINKKVYLLLLAGLVLVRLLLAYSQRVFLIPEGSGIDDMLMVRAAQSVANGGWLGTYGGMTIAKNMGFALWLVLLHASGIPFLLANAGLWIAASGFAVAALKPLFTGNLSRLILFGFFAFYPVSFAFFNQRVYRDSIFPSLCMLLFSGIVGMALRWNAKKLKGFILCAFIAGFGLAGGWLVREDGILLLLFTVCALLVLNIFLFVRKEHKRIQKLGASLSLLAVFCVAILGFSGLNYNSYHVFLVNDLNSGSFPRAYGAMVAVSEGEAGFVPRRPVTRKAIDALYREVPTFALLQEELDNGSVHSGFGGGAPDEFGGSFYFAVRLAAEYAGYLPDAKTADAFWAKIEEEIKLAVAEGRLKSVQPVASTVPRWHWELLAPTVSKTGSAAWEIFTLQDCDPRPLHSIGTEEGIQAVAEFVHSPVQEAFVAGTTEPYYNWGQQLLFTFCDILIWIYRIAMFPLFGLGLYSVALAFKTGFKRWKAEGKAPECLLLGVILLGLLLSVFLRFFVAAYMEIAAFGIGMYIMYLSGAGAPLLLFTALGAGVVSQRKESAR